jgi:hypothetical protein
MHHAVRILGLQSWEWVNGIFGMNFTEMPLLKHPAGFWISMGMMGVIVVGLLFVFRRKRYIEERGPDIPR